jgi:DNA-binding transcriptional regulator YdaS (Cro superfamily)
MNSNELIEKLGGTCAVAELVGVKPPSVSEWKLGSIPDSKLIRLAVVAEEKGIATRKSLFPNNWAEIWPELVGNVRQSKNKRKVIV